MTDRFEALATSITRLTELMWEMDELGTLAPNIHIDLTSSFTEMTYELCTLDVMRGRVFVSQLVDRFRPNKDARIKRQAAAGLAEMEAWLENES